MNIETIKLEIKVEMELAAQLCKIGKGELFQTTKTRIILLFHKILALITNELGISLDEKLHLGNVNKFTDSVDKITTEAIRIALKHFNAIPKIDVENEHNTGLKVLNQFLMEVSRQYEIMLKSISQETGIAIPEEINGDNMANFAIDTTIYRFRKLLESL